MSWAQVPATNIRKTASTNAAVTGAGRLKGISVNSTATGGVWTVYDSLTQANTIVAEGTLTATGSTFQFFGDEGTIFSTGLSVTVAGTASIILHYVPSTT